MVLGAISVLTLLVTEFTYIAQVNQKMAYDGFDQLKAHYLAKSGFKLSLLRLKAYQNVKSSLNTILGGNAAGVASLLPKQMIEKIWSFPFIFPIPVNIPGLSISDKEAITKFQKESGLDGKFSAIIESESSKFNLNLILSGFVPKDPDKKNDGQTKPNQGGTPRPSPINTSENPNPSPSPGLNTAAQFNPEEARKNLAEFLGRLIDQKRESDEVFAQEYRDLKMDELVDNIIAWADVNYEKRFQNNSRELIGSKQAPFYSLSELHMIQGMDDTLFNLFAPNLTVNPTPGININTMNEFTLRAIVPNLTDDEVKEFFKYRDSDEEDHYFKKSEDFLKYLNDNSAAYRATKTIEEFKAALAKKNIRIVTEESDFKITVRAEVNESTRLIEAWVTLTDLDSGQKNNKTVPFNPTSSGISSPSDKKAGIRITYFRMI